jgi:threonyl-tRNA synthetase
MAKIKIELPDGSVKEFEKGITGHDIAKSIGERLAKDALAIEVDGQIEDLHAKINGDSKIRIITYRDPEGKDLFRHTAAHVMADAVLRIFPKAKLTIGPTVEDGFYYDFDVERPFTEEDLAKIEKEMEKIVAEDHKFIRLEPKDKKEAKDLIKKHHSDNQYKLELINELGDEEISYYQHGKFMDLCRGPHLPSTGRIKAFKLTKIAGAYWRGDAKNRQLQRIYGVAFPEKKELENYLKMLEEAEKRDHRVLGKKLEIFNFDEVSPGSAFFLPKGTIIYNELLSFMREEYRKRGYEEVITPLLYDKTLWETSGHWGHYRENMFELKVDGRDFALKPMNCPSHCMMYQWKTRSYRDLPWRVADFAPLHRNELRGVLGGLTRVRKFCQDDAHIFCTMEQMEGEIDKLIEFTKYIYKDVFDFSYHVELSTRPENSIGTKEQWDLAESILKKALDKNKFEYRINEGDGAFYGPKIDFHIKDVLGRTWQLATIQADFNLPQRFGLKYEGSDNKGHTPVMLHRALLGSLERFIAILLEHFEGKFPLWLSPEQVRVMTVSQNHEGYAEKIRQIFFASGIRVEIDNRAESIPRKVREAQLDKIPVMLTVGEKEEAEGTVAVRTLDGQVKFGIKTNALLETLKANIAGKNLKLSI